MLDFIFALSGVTSKNRSRRKSMSICRRIKKVELLESRILLAGLADAEWSVLPVPADAGNGLEWRLATELSDEFNEDTIGTVADQLQKTSGVLDWNIAPDHDDSIKWVDSKPDGWLGPGATYFDKNKPASDKNYEIQNSKLIISATKVPLDQQVTNLLEPEFTRSVYTSYITSKHKFGPGTFTEALIRTSSTKVSTNFWTLSDSNETEIDVVEVYGDGNWFPRRPSSNVHIFKRGGDGGNNNSDQVHHVHQQSLAGQWTRWGVDWKSTTELDFYINGQLVRQLDLATGNNVVYNENGEVVTSANCDSLTQSTCMGTDGYNWDATSQFLNEDMRLIFDLEAHSWRGEDGIPSDADLANPSVNQMQVEWVRTYQRIVANQPASGVPIVQGSAQQGRALMVDTSGIQDPNGLGEFVYQWMRDGVNISGANASTYVLSNGDIDSTVSLQIAFIDGGGSEEFVFSDDVGPVFPRDIDSDFGDAPESFGTRFADDGPSHAATGPRLGQRRDVDPDGFPSTSATGDDDSSLSDEDGVMFGGITPNGSQAAVNVDVQQDAVNIDGQQAAVNIDGQQTASPRIDAWIDFDQSNNFTSNEKILDGVAVSGGLQTLNYDLPAGLTAGDRYARVRISSIGGLSPTGFAPDGEVEDYLISVDAPKVEAITVNGGDAQRSSLDSVTVTFDRDVEIDQSGLGAFQVLNLDTLQSVDHKVSVQMLDGRTVVDLSFTPSTSSVNEYGSLETANYKLVILSSRLSSATVSMTGDHIFGDHNPTDAFFRKYGDINGDDAVGLTDFAGFRGSFGKAVGEPGYQVGLDVDGDGRIGLKEFAAFRVSFGT
ncbi:Extracellular agarase precursor [Rubripirellula obstinata]|uniref:Extracellular agarase n=1 Tax=Rubripirellula obstinata TaxID=406547 RepID=A0A5B1CMG2_9BACT|nr:GEVED domain-containing protein [Rubripirellula obstinata]KAA1261095.1 Extracellular agarase precursor [Rubripirellula obstinata]